MVAVVEVLNLPLWGPDSGARHGSSEVHVETGRVVLGRVILLSVPLAFLVSSDPSFSESFNTFSLSFLPGPLRSFTFILSFPWCRLSVPRKHFCCVTDQPEVVGGELKLGALILLPGTSLGLSLSLVSMPFCSYTPHPSSLSPLPAPPGTAASAWEITDTESAASATFC